MLAIGCNLYLAFSLDHQYFVFHYPILILGQICQGKCSRHKLGGILERLFLKVKWVTVGGHREVPWILLTEDSNDIVSVLWTC
jgi:hypothetical protein